MRLHVWLVVLAIALFAAVGASTARAATVCAPGDVCVVTGGYMGLQRDIATAGAPAAVTALLTREVALSQALHPPNPCYAGHPPGPCTPSYLFLPSEYLLVLVDYQVGALSGLVPGAGCLGSCLLSPDAARVIDSDIGAIFADQTMLPPGPPCLPLSGSCRAN